MSWETQSWAAKQRPGSASAKLVLLGLASCADANHCAFPSVQWLCDFSDLNRKTVIAAIQRLEDGMFPLIEDTGERRGRTGQVKVYRLAAADAGAQGPLGSDPASETVPKAEQFQKRNSSTFSSKQSQKRDTEPVLNLPPSLDKSKETPAAELDDGSCGLQPPSPSTTPDKPNGRGSRLADDWEAPPVNDLAPSARKLVQQWPSGAYEAVCETFRLHWQCETRAIGCKRDWGAALAKWLINDHAKIMRDAKAGVSFAALAVRADAQSRLVAPAHPAQEREDKRSADVRAVLRDRLGAQTYDHWFLSLALVFTAPRGLNVISESRFVSDWVEDHFKMAIAAAAQAVTGSNSVGVFFRIEKQNREGR